MQINSLLDCIHSVDESFYMFTIPIYLISLARLD